MAKEKPIHLSISVKSEHSFPLANKNKSKEIKSMPKMANNKMSDQEPFKTAKRRRWSKWHQEPLFSQLQNAIRAVRFQNKNVAQACRESLPWEGCTQRIPHRTLRRHVAMSRNEPGTFLYMPPSTCELQKLKINPNSANACKRAKNDPDASAESGTYMRQNAFGVTTQHSNFGDNFGVATAHHK